LRGVPPPGFVGEGSALPSHSPKTEREPAGFPYLTQTGLRTSEKARNLRQPGDEVDCVQQSGYLCRVKVREAVRMLE
jgi:hypothetical protein